MRSRIPVNTCKSEYTVKITGIFIVMRIIKTIKKAQRVSVIFPEHRELTASSGRRIHVSEFNSEFKFPDSQLC